MTEAEYIAVNNKAKLELAELIVNDLHYDNGTHDWGKQAVILNMLEGMRMKAARVFDPLAMALEKDGDAEEDE